MECLRNHKAAILGDVILNGKGYAILGVTILNGKGDLTGSGVHGYSLVSVKINKF